MKLKDRAIVLSSIGFALGMLSGILVTAILTTTEINDGKLYLCAPGFTAFIGNELAAFAIEALVLGVYGAACMGFSVVYRIENWSILKATVTHSLVTVTIYFATATFLRWYSPASMSDILIMLAIFMILYVSIWLTNFLVYKIQIKEINKKLDIMKTHG